MVDEKPAPLYGLKPQDAPGVSVHSKIMRQTRIYFTLNPDNRAAILKIVDRDDVSNFEYTLGLGNARS